MSLEGKSNEKEPKSFVEIEWDPNHTLQKFVDFEDEEGNYYVYSCPKEEGTKQHGEIIEKAKIFFGITGDIKAKHGGFLKQEKGKVFATGESIGLGAFNHEKTRAALQKAGYYVEIV